MNRDKLFVKLSPSSGGYLCIKVTSKLNTFCSYIDELSCHKIALFSSWIGIVLILYILGRKSLNNLVFIPHKIKGSVVNCK